MTTVQRLPGHQPLSIILPRRCKVGIPILSLSGQGNRLRDGAKGVQSGLNPPPRGLCAFRGVLFQQFPENWLGWGWGGAVTALSEEKGEGWLWGCRGVWLFVGSFPGLCVNLSVSNVYWLGVYGHLQLSTWDVCT